MPNHGRSRGRGAGFAASGPEPYHADAVHFDGLTKLVNAALVATDSRYFGAACFFKFASINNQMLYVVDPEALYAEYLWFPINIDFSSTAALGKNLAVQSTSAGAVGQWHSLVVASDTTTGISKIYIDRVDVTGATYVDVGRPFVQAFNGLPLFIGTDTVGDDLVGDIADLRIAPAQNWLTAGDISPVTLDLFSTPGNKPVDPATATATLGAPAALFSGNAAAFGTNQGTGGAFTTTGVLTNASTSPSD